MVVLEGDLQMADESLEMGVHRFAPDALNFLYQKTKHLRDENCDEDLVDTAKYLLALGMELEHLSTG